MATDRLLQRLSGHAHPTGTAIQTLGASGKTTVAFTHPITHFSSIEPNNSPIASAALNIAIDSWFKPVLCFIKITVLVS
jgi:hypothetical protein